MEEGELYTDDLKPSPMIRKIRLDYFVGREQIKTKDDLPRRPRDFGEISVPKGLKFRDHYLVISRRYKK